MFIYQNNKLLFHISVHSATLHPDHTDCGSGTQRCSHMFIPHRHRTRLSSVDCSRLTSEMRQPPTASYRRYQSKAHIRFPITD